MAWHVGSHRVGVVEYICPECRAGRGHSLTLDADSAEQACSPPSYPVQRRALPPARDIADVLQWLPVQLVV